MSIKTVCGIILCHALQHRLHQDAFRTLRNGLLCRNNTRSVLLQDTLIMGAVETVAGETIELPYEHNIELLFLAVLDHALEFRAMVCPRRIRPVDIRSDDLHIVVLSVLGTLPDLTFDALFTLVV